MVFICLNSMSVDNNLLSFGRDGCLNRWLTGDVLHVSKIKRNTFDAPRAYFSALSKEMKSFSLLNLVQLLLPVLVLFFGFAVSYWAWEGAKMDARQKLANDFEFRVRELSQLIEQRMLAYEQLLRGVNGLFTATGNVNREVFHNYINTLRLSENYPRLLGVNYNLVVADVDKSNHVAELRRQGFTEYTIRSTEQRDFYVPIVYMEPFRPGSEGMLGYDVFADPVRRATLEQARDSGNATISSKIALLQDTRLQQIPIEMATQQATSGFLIYLPVYQHGITPTSEAERRTSIKGWIGASFRLNDLMVALLQEQVADINVEIFDDGDSAQPTLIYDSDDSHSKQQRHTPRFYTTTHIDIAGHTWLIKAHSLPAFEAQVNSDRPRLVAGVGAGVTTILSLLFWFLVTTRIRATRAAQKMSAELEYHEQSEKALQASEQRLHEIINMIPVGLFIKDADSRITLMNRACEEQWGMSFTDLEGTTASQFFPPDQMEVFLARDQAAFAGKELIDFEETAWSASLGENRIVHTFKKPVFDNKNRSLYLIGVSVDITERKQSELHEHWRNYVLELLAKGEPLAVLLDAVVRGVETERPSSLCTILLLDEKEKRLYAAATPSMPVFFSQAINGIEIGAGVISCGAAAYLKQRFIAEDIQTNPYWLNYREVAAQAELGACWSEPIIDVAGNVLGTFAIYHRKPSRPNQDDIQLIKHVANLVGIAIQRHRNEESLQLASMIYQNSSEAMLVCDVDNRIVAVNPSFTHITGYNSDEVMGKNPRMLSSGRHDKTFYQLMWLSLSTTGQWQGEVWNRRKNGEEFAEWLTINTISNSEGMLHRYVALFSDITEKKQSDEIIWRQANFDVLTQLPNRRMSRDRLEHEIKKAHRANCGLALLFIDLDQFKEVNDTLGHHVGDALLIEAARRICACVRDSDTVARLGGDEFTIILAELTETGCVERIAQSIIQALGQSFTIDDEVIYVSASIGITLYPTDATDADNLLKNADQAMYVAKNTGRNRFSYFTQSLQILAQARQVLVKDLRFALMANQFCLYFQPIIDMTSQRVVKVEALIRWRHPQRGIVSPIEFITASEETGLINAIGDWVFKEATQYLKKWLSWYPGVLQMSINVSPIQFYAHDYSLDIWLAHLRELGLPPHSVVIEITEGILLQADMAISEKLVRLHDAGILVSIDDFGTGYSSLSYLKKFAVDYLKIDQSFVRDLATDPNDLALSEAIIVMAHKLGLKVVAEGIETSEQCALLMSAGCDYGQGYLFSKPIPALEFERLLKSSMISLVDSEELAD